MDARASGADSVQKVCGAGEGAVLVGASINGMVRKKQLARHHGGGVRERSGRMRCRRKGVVEGYGRRVGVGLDPVG